MKIAKILLLVLAVAATLLLASCGKSGGKQERTILLVSAAASLKDSLERIGADYGKDHPEVDIRFNYGSSGTLQKQIEQGAPADLFLSAGRKQMDALTAKKLVSESRDVLSNRLVLILSADSRERVESPEALLKPGYRNIAIGEPNTVPAGMYAKQALTALGLWDKLQDKLVFAKDVRQVLTLVESGNADAGFVYRTDAGPSERVAAALDIPDDAHDPIVYPFGIVAASKHPQEVSAFYRYLTSEPALQVFRDHGFRIQ
ncbi:molybdate ABC transporter substrate-binding protein [Cohnella sp. CFH 77786]|uniref:molybdate ABC transporter substrate-binding protein n=1 Tax=Cohnella sp. CFH 77786 TaxID=2662265 RepID=UPI001ED5AE0A|nr:molybdate ABC transporter substrate-binding protein [Cohnella sp. CFH 77786]MBW5446227.1 molybdate ABC transporter substrate-binding protein [Cohnella sp. CFH 77786]